MHRAEDRRIITPHLSIHTQQIIVKGMEDDAAATPSGRLHGAATEASAVFSPVALSVRVTGHRRDGDHTVYIIRSSEGHLTWHVERRWNDVRTLYYEMWRAWKAQLFRSLHVPPKFLHHNAATASSRQDPKLIAFREATLAELLHFFVHALDVSLLRKEGPEVLRRFLSEDAPILPPLRTPGKRLLLAQRMVSMSPGSGWGDEAASWEQPKPIDPPYCGKTELTPLELQAACDEPTPLERFFTPYSGWPAAVASDSSRGRDACCQLFMEPTARVRPHASHDDNGDRGGVGGLGGGDAKAPGDADNSVGEIRVEVLEASGLPNLDTFSLTDAYAVVLFEGSAARTCTIDDDLDPKWHSRAPRAFRLPVRHAWSTLFVGLFDDDSSSSLGALDDDDAVGRVLIQPASLPPRTVVDCWWSLHHKAVGERPGVRGAIRLRICVEWHQERVLLLHPARLLTAGGAAGGTGVAPAFELPLLSRRAYAAVEYTFTGSQPEKRYSYAILRANLADVARLALRLKAPMAPLREILFWKRPYIAAALCVAWQWLVNHPQYFPAMVPFVALIMLGTTYATAVSAPPLLQPLSFWRLCLAIVLPHALRPRHEVSAGGEGKPQRRASTLPWAYGQARETAQMAWTQLQGTFERTLASLDRQIETTLGLAGTHASSSPAVSERVDEVSSSSVELLSDEAAIETVRTIYRSTAMLFGAVGSAIKATLRIRGPSGTRRRRGPMTTAKALDAVKGAVNSIDTNAINPMAWVLGPVQNMLGDVLVQMRAVERLVTWQDSSSAAVVCLVLIAVTVLLAIIPWAIVVPFVLRWVARTVGFILLGPHMLYVGRRLEAIERQQQIDERQRLQREERARAQHESSKTPSTTAAAPAATPDSSKPDDHDYEYVFEMGSSRSLPRQPCLPDVSSSYSLTPAEPAAQIDRNTALA